MTTLQHPLLHYRNIAAVCLLIGLGAGCADPSSGVRSANSEACGSSVTAGARLDRPHLQAALLPREDRQPVRVSVHEERVTTTHEGVRTRHAMQLDLQGQLWKVGMDGEGHVAGKLALDRIQLRYGVIEPENKILSYDSQKDQPDKGNPLADLMQIVSGAELDLAFSPQGELVHLSGLDPRWRGAGVVMAPPPLMQAQWTFRDTPMRYLLAEALFPSLPADEVAVDDTWSSSDMIYVPIVSRLRGETRNRLAEIHAFRQDDHTRLRCVIQRESTIHPAAPILEGRPPSLRTEVREGKQTGTLEVVPGTGDMRYTITRQLDLAVYQVPPEGRRSPPLTIAQTFAVDVKRGREATKRVP